MKIYAILKYIFVVFYLFAGIYHFINPKLYLPLIPSYLANYKVELNILAGIAEIIVALLMVFPATQKLASWATVAMLIAFIPSHIYFIQQGNLPIGKFTITPTIAWIRLIIIHPILIYWAWWLGKT